MQMGWHHLVMFHTCSEIQVCHLPIQVREGTLACISVKVPADLYVNSSLIFIFFIYILFTTVF